MQNSDWFSEPENIRHATKVYDHPRCSECGVLVETGAESCPHCGAFFFEETSLGFISAERLPRRRFE